MPRYPGVWGERSPQALSTLRGWHSRAKSGIQRPRGIAGPRRRADYETAAVNFPEAIRPSSSELGAKVELKALQVVAILVTEGLRHADG